MAGFFLRCHTESTSAAGLDLSATRVTHVRFVKCDAGFALLVCAGCLTGSHVELWQLGHQPVPLHRFFQPPDAASPLTVPVIIITTTINQSICFLDNIVHGNYNRADT